MSIEHHERTSQTSCWAKEKREHSIWIKLSCADRSEDDRLPWWLSGLRICLPKKKKQRICLSMQGTWVWSLVREDPTRRGATKPLRHDYWACAVEPVLYNTRSHRKWKARAPQKKSRPHSLQLEKAQAQQPRPMQINKIIKKEVRLVIIPERRTSYWKEVRGLAGVLVNGCVQSGETNQATHLHAFFIRKKIFLKGPSLLPCHLLFFIPSGVKMLLTFCRKSWATNAGGGQLIPRVGSLLSTSNIMMS